jgi:hypothetical protein
MRLVGYAGSTRALSWSVSVNTSPRTRTQDSSLTVADTTMLATRAIRERTVVANDDVPRVWYSLYPFTSSTYLLRPHVPMRSGPSSIVHHMRNRHTTAPSQAHRAIHSDRAMLLPEFCTPHMHAVGWASRASHFNHRAYICAPPTLILHLSEEARTLFVLVLVVHATRRLARVGRVANGAVLPVGVIDELALEVECVVDGGEAEFDVVALADMLV